LRSQENMSVFVCVCEHKLWSSILRWENKKIIRVFGEMFMHSLVTLRNLGAESCIVGWIEFWYSIEKRISNRDRAFWIEMRTYEWMNRRKIARYKALNNKISYLYRSFSFFTPLLTSLSPSVVARFQFKSHKFYATVNISTYSKINICTHTYALYTIHINFYLSLTFISLNNIQGDLT
jgi:hypothetical protein